MIANWNHHDVEASRENYEIHNMIGAQLGMSYYRSLGAENAIDTGDLNTASEILGAALNQARNTGEGYWLPQLLRLQSRIETDPNAALTHLVEAVEKARASGAFMLEALAIIDILSMQTTGGKLSRARLQDLITVQAVELPDFAKARLDALTIGAN